MSPSRFNAYGVRAIYYAEMVRFKRTLWQSIAAPVLTTVLYFVVFGAAIGGRVGDVGGVSYGAYIVPGLIMLTVFTESLSNAAFGIHMPKFTGTIYEVLSAPVSALEIVLAYVGAATTKSVLLAMLIYATANLFVPIELLHPGWMVLYVTLVAAAFSLAGFVIGIIARGFEELQFVPLLIVTPLTFLGGVFYSIDMLPEPWRTVSLFNPIVYMISGFRWTFYGASDVPLAVSLAVVIGMIAVSFLLVWWILRTGYRLKT